MKVVRWNFDYRESLVDASTDEEAIELAMEGNRLYEEYWGGADGDEAACIADRNYYEVLGDVDFDWIAEHVGDEWYGGRFGRALVFVG